MSGEGFQDVLVGKDGGPKVSLSQPIAPNKPVTTIDAMPVHQQETQRQWGMYGSLFMRDKPAVPPFQGRTGGSGSVRTEGDPLAGEPIGAGRC
jgi:hypothetical protein